MSIPLSFLGFFHDHVQLLEHPKIPSMGLNMGKRNNSPGYRRSGRLGLRTRGAAELISGVMNHSRMEKWEYTGLVMGI